MRLLGWQDAAHGRLLVDYDAAQPRRFALLAIADGQRSEWVDPHNATLL